MDIRVYRNYKVSISFISLLLSVSNLPQSWYNLFVTIWLHLNLSLQIPFVNQDQAARIKMFAVATIRKTIYNE